MLESFDYLLQLKLLFDEIRKLTLMFDDLFASTVLPLIAITTLLCQAGENCKRQSLKTGILIQRLLHSKYKYTNAKVYNDLLFEFAMEIQQDPMKIAVKEFVTVDLRLLMKIFTAIVTYLVILLQFRWTYPEDYGDAV
ncbi:PREDICTED: putative gustatory receptor 39b isoform X2 [Rhagoletis zephyria]|uniref:putative gustatory receptor 39b isoform X2 n=1 Tax=Rhagoletis zephyria TaxID=28612 RepID=UPI0008116FE7|nr:PREDICTED: putative gustatory receptor 39b isoform X2 [Rhagoletis zephyria]